jgi:hypothetical protein
MLLPPVDFIMVVSVLWKPFLYFKHELAGAQFQHPRDIFEQVGEFLQFVFAKIQVSRKLVSHPPQLAFVIQWGVAHWFHIRHNYSQV